MNHDSWSLRLRDLHKRHQPTVWINKDSELAVQRTLFTVRPFVVSLLSFFKSDTLLHLTPERYQTSHHTVAYVQRHS